jgi:hypothetical protein
MEFSRTFESSHVQSFAVYGLGRQCLEDFLEIALMVENSLYVGAQNYSAVFSRGWSQRTSLLMTYNKRNCLQIITT